MKFVSSVALAVVLWLGAAVGTVSAEVLMGQFEDRTVARDVSFPVDITWLHDDRMLVAQKKGTIMIFDRRGDDFVNRMVALDLRDRFCDNGERGVGAVQVHPNFSSQTNRWIYVYYTYKKFNNCNQNGSNGPVNRLSRFWMPVGSRTIDKSTEEPLFDTPPLAYRYHNAGKVEFGKDGMLYVTVGEAGLKSEAQNPGSLLGVMVRLTPDGGIPDGNPFKDDNKGVRCNENGIVPTNSPDGAKCKEIVSLGLRNPFRMSMDPNTSGNKVRYFINDVGSSKWEEIDEGGDDIGYVNYGYPVREGPCIHHRDDPSDCQRSQKFKEPIHFYRHTNVGGAATASAFVPNNIGWPSSFENSYLYGDYALGKIYRMKDSGIAEDRNSNPPKSNKDIAEFANHPYVVTMRFGPYKNTQALYYTSVGSSGVIRRISYVGNSNNAPQAVISANPWQGSKPLTVQFTAQGSSDLDGDALNYKWDLNNDGNFDAWNKNPSYIFDSDGTHKVTLTVTDGKGGSDTTDVQIKVGSPPIPKMTSPAEGATFEVGQVFRMSGYDEGDPNAIIEWEIRQHHNQHWHPYLVKSVGMNNRNSPAAPEPEDYIAATNSHLEFILTVTNSIGLSSTLSRFVRPRKVPIGFDTEPTGLMVSLNGTVLDAPGTAITWQSQNLGIKIADYQYRNGKTYSFSSWSNGGNQNQTFVVPNDGAEVPKLIATYTEAAGVTPPPGPSPTSAPPAGPSGTCLQVLLYSGDILQSGSWKAGTDVYIYQETNGNLYVRKGSYGNQKELVFQSGIAQPQGEYYTKLQGDGNLLTRPVDAASRGLPSVVWKSMKRGNSHGTYFLALDCGEETISVYKGTLSNPQGAIWTSPMGYQSLPPGPSPTSAPPPPPPPPGPSGMCPQVLLYSGDILQSGSWKAGTDVYIYQETNGNFYVRKGSYSSPKELVFQSGIAQPQGEYYTKLQGDGNLLTRPVDADSRGLPSVVWKSMKRGNSHGTYFLALDCGEETISVYQGTPISPQGAIWTSPVD